MPKPTYNRRNALRPRPGRPLWSKPAVQRRLPPSSSVINAVLEYADLKDDMGGGRVRNLRKAHDPRRCRGGDAEERIDFVQELSAQVARSPHGQAVAYPVVRTLQSNGICAEVVAPAPGLAAQRHTSWRSGRPFPPAPPRNAIGNGRPDRQLV